MCKIVKETTPQFIIIGEFINLFEHHLILRCLCRLLIFSNDITQGLIDISCDFYAHCERYINISYHRVSHNSLFDNLFAQCGTEITL